MGGCPCERRERETEAAEHSKPCRPEGEIAPWNEQQREPWLCICLLPPSVPRCQTRSESANIRAVLPCGVEAQWGLHLLARGHPPYSCVPPPVAFTVENTSVRPVLGGQQEKVMPRLSTERPEPPQISGKGGAQRTGSQEQRSWRWPVPTRPNFLSRDPRGTKSSVASSGCFRQHPGDTPLLLGPTGHTSRELGHSTEPARRLQAGRCHHGGAPGPPAPGSRCRRGDPRGQAGCSPTPGPPEWGTAGDRGRPATAFSSRDSGTGPSRRGPRRSPPLLGAKPPFPGASPHVPALGAAPSGRTFRFQPPPRSPKAGRRREEEGCPYRRGYRDRKVPSRGRFRLELAPEGVGTRGKVPRAPL